MKKFYLFILVSIVMLFSACHDKIWDAIDDLDARVARLEELCKEMNTNISSLKTIVEVIQENDFITDIVPIEKGGEVIGYTIMFGKHEPITIYNGEDGKDGQNGSATAPIIGVAKDADGVYYWTLNGEWLLDDEGNKLPVSGKNGNDGVDGEEGKDGQNGQDGKPGADGKDGVTPQLKIENGYWYVSYDNGATWTELGKAVGEDGKSGVDGEKGDKGDKGDTGEKGDKGDSMFLSVTQDENYVYFTLSDGTVIKIAKGKENNDQTNSDFVFVITYDSNGGEGIMDKDTFSYGHMGKISVCTFTRDAYYCLGWNTSSDGSGAFYNDGCELTIDKNITLYAQWEKAMGTPSELVDLGLSVKWASYNIGAFYPEHYGDYFAWGETKPKEDYSWETYKYCKGTSTTITKYLRDADNGDYKFIDGKTKLDLEDDAARVNWGGKWRMPTHAEWKELHQNCTFVVTNQNGVRGIKMTSKISGYTDKFIFIPIAGHKEGTSSSNNGNYAYYWVRTLNMTTNSSRANMVFISTASSSLNFSFTWGDRCFGYSIRPVHP